MEAFIISIATTVITLILKSIYNIINNRAYKNSNKISERYKLYQDLYFELLALSKYSILYSSVKYLITVYNQSLEERETYMLMQPYLRNSIRKLKSNLKIHNKSSSFIIMCLTYFQIQIALYMIKSSVKKEYFKLASKLGYPVNMIKYYFSNILLYAMIATATLLASFNNLKPILENNYGFYQQIVALMLVLFITLFLKLYKYINIY